MYTYQYVFEYNITYLYVFKYNIKITLNRLRRQITNKCNKWWFSWQVVCICIIPFWLCPLQPSFMPATIKIKMNRVQR